jgi:hypothetical protein
MTCGLKACRRRPRDWHLAGSENPVPTGPVGGAESGGKHCGGPLGDPEDLLTEVDKINQTAA